MADEMPKAFEPALEQPWQCAVCSEIFAGGAETANEKHGAALVLCTFSGYLGTPKGCMVHVCLDCCLQGPIAQLLSAVIDPPSAHRGDEPGDDSR